MFRVTPVIAPYTGKIHADSKILVSEGSRKDTLELVEYGWWKEL